jgi:hypothetical protein
MVVKRGKDWFNLHIGHMGVPFIRPLGLCDVIPPGATNENTARAVLFDRFPDKTFLGDSFNSQPGLPPEPETNRSMLLFGFISRWPTKFKQKKVPAVQACATMPAIFVPLSGPALKRTKSPVWERNPAA